MTLKVSDNHRLLERDGKPFFWLGDTCWSAFTNITETEWEQYLEKRKAQGISVIQINALGQWDRSGAPHEIHPFATEDGTVYDFTKMNNAYFERASAMVKKAVEKGFVPAIVVMWCNYVPDTWASKIFPENILPEDLVEPVVTKIISTFRKYDPVWIISGDTGFEGRQSIERYLQVSRLVKALDPDHLRAFHIKGRYDVIPEELVPFADLWLYQSGHNLNGQHSTYELARSFFEREPAKPVINAEPCYEMMGYSHGLYGRFDRDDVRKALWQSLLSGAYAGITYGGHGIWNWQQGIPRNTLNGRKFGEGFLKAYPYVSALQFPGVMDYAKAEKLFEDGVIREPQPCQKILADDNPEIRCAENKGGYVIYLPVNAPLRLKGDFSCRNIRAVDPRAESGYSQSMTKKYADGITTIDMDPFCKDVLIFLEGEE